MIELDPNEAYRLATRLTTIPDCPRSGQAVEALADDLREICRGAALCAEDWEPLEQARWLVGEARRTWRTWQGTEGLYTLYRSRFASKDERTTTGPAYEPFSAIGSKPVVACQDCQDFCTVRREGRHEWCTCQQGDRMQAESPGWLDTLNRTTIGKLGPMVVARQQVQNPGDEARKPIRDADFSEETFIRGRQLVQQRVDQALVTLADGEATREAKEIAREVLKLYGVNKLEAF